MTSILANNSVEGLFQKRGEMHCLSSNLQSGSNFWNLAGSIADGHPLSGYLQDLFR